jgi:hypothetical protein
MDWADNMRGLHELSGEPEGQLIEGPSAQHIAIVVTPPEGEQQRIEVITAATPVPALVKPPAPVPPPAVLTEGSRTEGDRDGTEGRGGNSAADTTPTAVSAADSGNTGDIAARAKDFIRKDAEKKVALIMQTLGDDALAYNTIKKNRQQQHTTVDLKSGGTTPAADLGSMTAILDGRFRLVEREICLGQKQTWTYSFNTKTMECIGCKEHLNAQPFPRRGSNLRGGRQVIWLTDESMPPILPVCSRQQCVKIIRLESGMLQELAEGLVRTLSGRQIAAGSSVLMTSATNMAAAGTAGYAEDLLAAIKFLRRSIGDHLIYGPLPNILLNGCGDWSTIRTSVEVAMWAMLAFKDSPALLQNSYRLLEKMLGDRSIGEAITAQTCVLRLPMPNNSFINVTSAPGDIPCKVALAKQSEEEVAVICIVDEIRDRLAVDLDPNPVVNRWPVLPATSADGGDVKRYLVVGSSHAGKLGAALRRAGHVAEVIYESNWRATRDTVYEMTERVIEKMERSRVDVLVLCILDNSVYFALMEDGSTQPASRDKNGVYHMTGDIIVSSKPVQHSLFKNILPLLEAARGKPCILCSPLPRYLAAGCCENEAHMPNRKLRTFEHQLHMDLKETAENFRDFLFTSGHKLIKVLDPAVSWRGKDNDSLWGADPVHPTDMGYGLLADGAAMLLRHMESGARKRPRANSFETGPSGREPHLNRGRQDEDRRDRNLQARGRGGNTAGFGPGRRGRGGGHGGRGGN